ncbi:MAG: hypothetical protein DYG89_43640 [Caldilinea sp. CFX5]|nr:hypothetical protein [Caldilinea sp. CFX5]
MRFKFLAKLAASMSAVLLAGLLTACVAPPIQPPAANQPNAPVAQAAVPATVAAMRTLLGKQLAIDPATIDIVNAETAEFDGCLGVARPNEPCTKILIPGYKMTFAVNGQEYVLHSDQGGYRYRVATAPAANVGELLLAWGGTVDNGETMEALIGTAGVAFGLSGDQPRIGGHFVTPARQAVLNEWVSRFAPFDAETDDGSIRLVGSGTAVATPEDQQMIGRWAQLVAMEAMADESLAGLRYEGPAEIGSDDTSKCAVLQLGTPVEAGIGACDGTMTNKELGKAVYLEWEALRDRFAPFVLETATERLTFEGMGGESNKAWQRAILAWARTRHAELAGNRISATMATALSWHIGQDESQKNVCRHLTVLSYGYAYAEERQCEGGDLINMMGSWLTTDELLPFDTWLYDRAPFYHDNNYIDGKGTQELSEAEGAAVNAWAAALWSRIFAATSGFAPEADAGPCPEAHDDLAMVRDFNQGYCLLIPNTYTVFDIDPTQIVVARESLLNVTEPRLAIVVTAAEGRTAEQAAAAIVAEMSGFAIDRSTAEIAGQPAVILDNVPGQDLNRRVLIVHNDRLYDLTFSPLDNAELEAFYQTIIAHFVLIEPAA